MVAMANSAIWPIVRENGCHFVATESDKCQVTFALFFCFIKYSPYEVDQRVLCVLRETDAGHSGPSFGCSDSWTLWSETSLTCRNHALIHGPAGNPGSGALLVLPPDAQGWCTRGGGAECGRGGVAGVDCGRPRSGACGGSVVLAGWAPGW